MAGKLTDKNGVVIKRGFRVRIVSKNPKFVSGRIGVVERRFCNRFRVKGNGNGFAWTCWCGGKSLVVLRKPSKNH